MQEKHPSRGYIPVEKSHPERGNTTQELLQLQHALIFGSYPRHASRMSWSTCLLPGPEERDTMRTFLASDTCVCYPGGNGTWV